MNRIEDCVIYRDQRIDVIKGLGIILMVLGHCGFPFTHFVYLFHMPIFFIASGYCLKQNYTSSFNGVLSLIKKRIKSLYIPYILYNIIFLFLWNIFTKFNIYSDNSMFSLLQNNSAASIIKPLTIIDFLKKLSMIFLFFGNGGQMTGAFWFIRCLFCVTIGYAIIDCLINRFLKNAKLFIQGFISLCFLGFSFFLAKKNIMLFGLDLIFATYILFYIGKLLQEILVFDSLQKNIKILFFCISFVSLLICNFTGSIELSSRIYTNPFFYIVASMSGWFFLYGIAECICTYNFSKIFSYIGEHSIVVVGLHFLCFKIISFLQIKFYGYPDFMLASFPVLNGKEYWWIGYALFGVCIPLFCDKIVMLVKQQLKLFYERAHK